MAHTLCQSIRSVLAGDEEATAWSQRARQRIGEIREDFPWVSSNATTLLQEPDGGVRWYTFAGGIANTLLADSIPHSTKPLPDNLSVRFRPPCDAEEIHRLIASLVAEDLRPITNEEVMQQLKFSECLSPPLAAEVFAARFHDPVAIAQALREPRRIAMGGAASSPRIETHRPARGTGGTRHKLSPSQTPCPVADDPELRKALTGVKALSMRQPHAEAVMRGLKDIEYRSGPTKVRGRILIYASRNRYPPDEEQEMMEGYGIDDVSCEDLPRGVLVGTVELHDSDDGEWYLRSGAVGDVARTGQFAPTGLVHAVLSGSVRTRLFCGRSQ